MASNGHGRTCVQCSWATQHSSTASDNRRTCRRRQRSTLVNSIDEALQNVNWGACLPSPFFAASFPFFSFSSLFSVFPFFVFVPSLKSKTSKFELGFLGSAVSSPQLGLGRSRSRNQIWCNYCLKI